MRGKRGEEARRRWRGLVETQAASAQTAAAFCQERSLCAPQFFSWKRKLRGEAGAGGFVELTVPAGDREAALELRLAGGRSIMVRLGFDAKLLQRLLAALEERR